MDEQFEFPIEFSGNFSTAQLFVNIFCGIKKRRLDGLESHLLKKVYIF